MSKPKSKIDELRAQLAAARAPREQKQAALDEAAEIARLEREIADEPAIAKAVEEHGAIGEMISVIHTPAGVVIVKRPRGAVWRKFSETHDIKSSDVLSFVKNCLVHPGKTEVEDIFEAYPVALETVAEQAKLLASVRVRDMAGK